MRNEMNIKNMWQKNGYILCPYRNKLQGHMADTDVRRISGLERHGEIRKGTGIAIFVRGSFGSYRQVAGGQTGRQYGRLYQTDSENQEKYNICFCIIFPKKRKWTIPDSQYLWVADRNAHEHSCPWTNKNIGNLKMMAENRTCLVASRRNKKKRQDYFESSSFSTNPIGIHSKLPCHFFLISIQYIYPSNT